MSKRPYGSVIQTPDRKKTTLVCFYRAFVYKTEMRLFGMFHTRKLFPCKTGFLDCFPVGHNGIDKSANCRYSNSHTTRPETGFTQRHRLTAALEEKRNGPII